MKYKILLVEDDKASLRILKRVISKAKLEVVVASTLTEAKLIFEQSTPESFLCAIVDYSLPDAMHGEAIDFAIDAFMPVIVLTDQPDADVRNRILSKAVVDYIPKHNHQVFEYLTRLLVRLEKNQNVGVLVVGKTRRQRLTACELLNRHNFLTYHAANSKDALELLDNHRQIRLVITESELRDQSGIQLVCDVRQQYSKEEISIIGLGASMQASEVAQFIKSGGDDFLRTPYCHEEFFCRILQNVEYVEQIELIRKTANTDYLTGLANRRQFFAEVEQLAKHHKKEVTVALVDLDYFKSINDTHGHDAGDAILKDVAKTMRDTLSGDIISRFGGEEFCICLANDKESAIPRLEAFRKAIAESKVSFSGKTLQCTLSIGAATTESLKDNNIKKLLGEADLNLYKAKSAGRNQVVVS